MLDSQIEPDEEIEYPEGLTEEEIVAILEDNEIERQISKYNL